MMLRRSTVDIVLQLAISASERPQPQHKPVSRSMSHSFTQGDWIPISMAMLPTGRM
jgi:hypothetical protein